MPVTYHKLSQTYIPPIDAHGFPGAIPGFLYEAAQASYLPQPLGEGLGVRVRIINLPSRVADLPRTKQINLTPFPARSVSLVTKTPIDYHPDRKNSMILPSTSQSLLVHKLLFLSHEHETLPPLISAVVLQTHSEFYPNALLQAGENALHIAKILYAKQSAVFGSAYQPRTKPMYRLLRLLESEQQHLDKSEPKPSRR